MTDDLRQMLCEDSLNRKIRAADTPSAPDAGAPEIEVTPAMVEAGAALLADYFDQAIDWLTEDRARTIYRAMHASRGST